MCMYIKATAYMGCGVCVCTCACVTGTLSNSGSYVYQGAYIVPSNARFKKDVSVIFCLDVLPACMFVHHM